MIFADDTPLIPDEHFEVDRHRSLEILQDVISGMRIVGFRTRLVFRSKKAARELFQNDQYLDADAAQYAGGTELEFNNALPPHVVEAISLDGDLVMIARTLVLCSLGCINHQASALHGRQLSELKPSAGASGSRQRLPA